MRTFLTTRRMDTMQYMSGKYLLNLISCSEILDSRYVILKKLGWGHFSTVWLAFNLSDKRIYALKILKSHKKYLDSAFDEEGICKIIADNYQASAWSKSVKQYLRLNPADPFTPSREHTHCL